MQIMIEIPDAMYEDIKSGKDGYSNYIHTAIRNGTPLQKGHGRLIDADKTISKICGSSCGCHLEECGYDEPCFSAARIKSAPTIIPADEIEREE